MENRQYDGKILVVEDEKSTIDYLSAILSKQGFEHSIAMSGMKAMRLIREQSFDLIILDLILPDTSGFDVLRELRSDSKYSDVAVIIVSASTEDRNIILGLELGANDFIAKPFSEIALLLKIRNHFELRKAIGDLQNQITNTGLLENQLSQFTQEFMQVFDNAPIIMMIVDKHGKIRNANRTAALMTNTSPESYFGKSSGDIFRCVHNITSGTCGKEEACAICPISNSLKYTFQTGEHIYKTDCNIGVFIDGKTQTLSFYLSTALITLNNEKHILLSLDNITAQRQAEQVIIKQVNELQEAKKQLEAQAEELMQITEHLNERNKELIKSRDGLVL